VVVGIAVAAVALVIAVTAGTVAVVVPVVGAVAGTVAVVVPVVGAVAGTVAVAVPEAVAVAARQAEVVFDDRPWLYLAVDSQELPGHMLPAVSF
jgi:hypothetical protein